MPALASDSAAHDDLADVLLAMPESQLEAFLGSLPADDLALAESALAGRFAIGWRSDPATMAAHLDARFRRWRYVRLLSAKFVEAATGVSTRQIWNMPARMGKSVLGSQWGPTWLLDRTEGRARLILISYGDELAMENAIGVRDRLIHHSDVLRAQLRPDRRRRDRFVTDAGGGVLAAGIDGTITGFGAGDGGGVVIDDPFKNWQQAHSPARREHVRNQFKGTIRNRLDDEGAFIIVIHHRVHEEDLTATLLADTAAETGDEWDLVSLPALAVAGDLLGRAPGEPLEPERFPLEAVIARARGMGSYLASALEQQNPTPEEGTELLRSWFVLAEAAEMPRKAERAISAWDLKLKNREAGDYVVGQCWWRVSGACWMVDQLRGQYDHATTANAIALLSVRHPEVKQHYIEAAGSADEVLPELRKPREGYDVSDEMARRLGMTDAERTAVELLRRSGMAHLITVPAKGDKSVRARSFIAPTAEDGNVRLPADAPWLAALLAEITAFPNGSNDDQVDTMSLALSKLAVGQATASAPTAGARPDPRAGLPPTTARRGASSTASVSVGRRPNRPGPPRPGRS